MQPILSNPVTAQDRQAGILFTYGSGNDAMTRRLLAGLSPEDYSPPSMPLRRKWRSSRIWPAACPWWRTRFR
ncbi:hypothetical protein RAA17_07250 [Komagataeibacter rhaeticus]|nr:hypothetical protein [Komagataeibacter rhaeticus]